MPPGIGYPAPMMPPGPVGFPMAPVPQMIDPFLASMFGEQMMTPGQMLQGPVQNMDQIDVALMGGNTRQSPSSQSTARTTQSQQGGRSLAQMNDIRELNRLYADPRVRTQEQRNAIGARIQQIQQAKRLGPQ